MPYTVDWGNQEHTILIQTYHGDVTDHDFMSVVELSATMLGQVNHPVDIIIDTTDSRINISNMIVMMIYANKKVPPNQRLVVGIGAPPILRQVIMVGRRVAPKATEKVHFVDSLEEALRIIANT